jgi:hypothetical protein
MIIIVVKSKSLYSSSLINEVKVLMKNINRF